MKDSLKKLWYQQAANRFVEALPLGNGKIGMMDYGNGQFSLNHESLWSGAPKQDNGEMNQDSLEKARKRIFEGAIEAAEKIIVEELQGDYKQTYLPLGKLFFLENDRLLVPIYRALDLEKGVSEAEGKSLNHQQNWRLQASVLRRQNLGIIRYQGKAELGVRFESELRIDSYPTDRERQMGYTITCPIRVPSYEEADQPIVYATSQNTVKAVLWLEMRESRLGQDYIFAIETNYLSGGQLADLSFEELAKVARTRVERLEDIDQALTQHQQEQKLLFERSCLDLPDNQNSLLSTDNRRLCYRQEATDYSLIGLYYHYGRYLLYSASWGDSLPANLQGIWNEQLRAPWCSNYTTNINLEMNYWAAEVGRVEEAQDSLIKMLIDIYDKQAGASYLFHHNLDCWLTTSPVNGSPSWAFWPMAPVWLSLTVFERKQQVEHRLPKKIDQVLVAVADFLNQWLYLGPDGKYHTCPSTSPENQYQTADGYIASVSNSTTMDLMLIRAFVWEYQKWLASCDDYPVQAPEILRQLEQKVKRLPEIPIHSDGYLQEWQHTYKEVSVGHRHLSHLVGYFPNDYGFQLGLDYIRAAELALLRRVEAGGDFTAWHCAWCLCLFARFNQSARAKKYLDILIGEMTCPNLFSAYMPNQDGKELFQIDGNLGGIRAIIEMIIYQVENRMVLLPVISKIIPRGKMAQLKLGKGHLVEVEWGQTVRLKLMPVCNQQIEVIYDDQKQSIDLEKGKLCQVDFDLV